MVEFVVALVCILILVAGIIQISVLGLRHSSLMNEARSDAGRDAMRDVSTFAGPLYVSECTVGADGIAFSRDDGKSTGDPADLSIGLAGYGHPDDLDGYLPGNPVTALSDAEYPQFMFGLIEGRKSDSVDLIPIMREMVYRKDAVDLEISAWMTWTRGIY